MKFNRIWLIISILLIIIILFGIYTLFNKALPKENFAVAEKLESLPQAIITIPTNTPVKQLILTGYDYLNLSEFRVFDPNGFEYIFNVDCTIETNSPQPEGSPWNLDKLTDNDPYTFFQTDSNSGPNGQPVSLIVKFNEFNGVFLGSILIRNRYDCCYERINKFSLHLYDGKGALLASKPLTDASLTNYQTGGWNYNITEPTFIAKMRNDLLQNHANDNVLLCKIAKPEANLLLNSNELVKKITLSGNNWLNISELGLYDIYGNQYKYIDDFTITINTSPNFLSNSPSYDFSNLFDNDPVSYFHSGQNTNVIFTVLFTNSVNLGKILIRNRYNANHSYIHSFAMKLYDGNNKELLSKPCQLIEPSLSNWREIHTVDITTDGAGDRSSTVYKNAVNNIKQNHMNDNVISYVLYRPQSTVQLHSDEAIRKITIKGFEWLQIAQLNIYNIDGNAFVYNTDFTVDTNTTPKTWDNNNLAYDFSKMFDNDPTTCFYSGSWFGPNESAMELSILFNDVSGVHISNIFIKNRMDCCWRRINAFTMHIYDIHNNKLSSEPLSHPYLTSYPRFTNVDDFKQNHLTDNAITYIVTKPYVNINAGSLTAGYNSVGIKNNLSVYTYSMGNIDNSKMHILNIPNYVFVAGETYIFTFTCYLDVSGSVSNNITFGYQSKSGKIYYTSPVLTSESKTYISTIVASENGLIQLFVNAPGNSSLYFTNFSVEQKKNIITLPANAVDYNGYTKSAANNIVSGNDIIKYSNYNNEQCKEACDNTNDCVAFVKNINNLYDNSCWLKYNTNNKSLNDNNLIMYEKSSSTPAPTIYVSSTSGLNTYGFATVTPTPIVSTTPTPIVSATPTPMVSATPTPIVSATPTITAK